MIRPFSLALMITMTGRLTAGEPSVATNRDTPWQRHVIDASSSGADGVKLGDMNGDGRPDITTGWEEGGEIRVYLNPGPWNAKQPWPHVTAGPARNVEDAIFVDADRDGLLDVVSCTEGKTRTVFLHRRTRPTDDLLNPKSWRTSEFPVTLGSQAWMQATAIDLDGQHGPDLVLGSKAQDAAIGWLQSPKDASRLADWQYHRLRTAGWVMSLEACDMDQDGDLDVLFSDRKGRQSGVFWLENPGPLANRQDIAWIEHAVGGAGREVMFVDRTDVNGDGLFDIAAAVKPAEILLFLRQSDGSWQSATIRLDTAQLGDAKAVKGVDINGDQRMDFVFTCENATGPREGVVWLEQLPSDRWTQHSLGGPAGVKYDLIQILDLDADGDSDVITCEEKDQLGVVWYENPLR